MFYDIGFDSRVYEHGVMDGSRMPRQAPLPKDSTTNGLALHNLTRLPSSACCNIRLRPKATGSYHEQQYVRRPLLQAVYGFHVDKDTRQEIPRRCCIDITTGPLKRAHQCLPAIFIVMTMHSA